MMKVIQFFLCFLGFMLHAMEDQPSYSHSVGSNYARISFNKPREHSRPRAFTVASDKSLYDKLLSETQKSSDFNRLIDENGIDSLLEVIIEKKKELTNELKLAEFVLKTTLGFKESAKDSQQVRVNALEEKVKQCNKLYHIINDKKSLLEQEHLERTVRGNLATVSQRESDKKRNAFARSRMKQELAHHHRTLLNLESDSRFQKDTNLANKTVTQNEL